MNVETTYTDKVRARFRRYRKRRIKPQGKRKSVRTVSGGLPSLGKR